MEVYQENPFVFSRRYRLLRHLLFWLLHLLVFSFLFRLPGRSYWTMNLISAIWVPACMLYSYPLMYYFIPRVLLGGKYSGFLLILLAWGVGGYFLNYAYRSFLLFPLMDYFKIEMGSRNPWATNSYLTMNVMAGFGSMIVLFKNWFRKQVDLLRAEKEKASAELELLKAQLHPHFLMNTLNNIYSFALLQSARTAGMILDLTSLLGYILYDCRARQVLLERELAIMQHYIDLEKERYGNTLEISVNIEGEIKNQFIAPLLLLPFLENAFKHGTSEVLDHPWLSMDVAVKNNSLKCKIINSKEESPAAVQPGIGILNVRKRLDYLYPGKHELRLSDEGYFYAVSLTIDLSEPDFAGAARTEASGFIPEIKPA